MDPVTTIDINNFFVPISDEDVPDKFMETLVKWRKLASDLGYFGYTGPVVWRVCPGFTLKAHASLAGPCYEAFEYLKLWVLQNDEPTKSAYVFFIPSLAEDSTRKNVEDQKTLLAETRKRYSLPEHHLSNFGSAAMLSGLILGHLKHTGDKSSLVSCMVRTDTLLQDRIRLHLNFDDGALRCAPGNWSDDVPDDLVGTFLLGVELD